MILFNELPRLMQILSPHPVDAMSNPYYQCRYLVDRNNFEKIIVPWFENAK